LSKIMRIQSCVSYNVAPGAILIIKLNCRRTVNGSLVDSGICFLLIQATPSQMRAPDYNLGGG
jgi:hypothetical protein